MISVFRQISLIVSILLCSLMASANEPSDIEKEVNELHADAAAIERDINLLEKDLLFPPLTRLEVFLSIDGSLNFDLNSIVLEIDGDEKSFHIYNASDLTALRLGGLQQFWEGNIALGKHELKAVLKGKTKDDDPIQQAVTYQFEKKKAGVAVELQIVPADDGETPTLKAKSWGKR